MKIAFIESAFHQRSQSSTFFKEILAKRYELTVMLDDPCSDSKKIKVEEINRNNFDVVIFWQFIKSPTDIAKINCKNIIWIPMYDSEIFRKFKRIRLYGYASLNIKILSFSRADTELLKNNNLKNILDVKYYPENKNINNYLDENDGLNVLFWQRRREINWNVVKQILGNNKIKKITIKTNFDLGMESNILPSDKDIEEYNIKILNTWLEKDEYLKMLKEHNIFIAPRIYEGIGMGFLDAMSYGLAVVSPNTATMNEYIKDKYNGYLYNLNNPKEIDFSELINIRKNIKDSIDNGYNNWLKEESKIISFIENKEIIKNKEINNLYKIYGLPLEYLILFTRKIFKIVKLIRNNFAVHF